MAKQQRAPLSLKNPLAHHSGRPLRASQHPKQPGSRDAAFRTAGVRRAPRLADRGGIHRPGCFGPFIALVHRVIARISEWLFSKPAAQ